MLQPEKQSSMSRRLSDAGADLDMHTDPSIDDLLNSEPSRHFPEKRDRRREDCDRTVIARLYSALEAIDRGEPYAGEDDDDHHLMEDCYRQF